MSLAKGKRAMLGKSVQDFSFETYNPALDAFEEHNFSQYLLDGKWLVLFFYPADFTFVCPTELAELARYQQDFDTIGTQLIAISTDTKYSNLAWFKAEKLLKSVKFPMASDPTGEISNYFNIFDFEVGTAMRGTFIINPKGELVGKEINLYNVGRSAQELLRKMQAFAYTYNNPHHVCPAGWKEEEDILVPSKNMVGRVYTCLDKE